MTAQHTRIDSTGTLLGNGDVFPALQLAAVGGGTISLPGDLAGSFGVVLFYRGSWCPYCNAQLAVFHRAEGGGQYGRDGGEGGGPLGR